VIQGGEVAAGCVPVRIVFTADLMHEVVADTIVPNVPSCPTAFAAIDRTTSVYLLGESIVTWIRRGRNKKRPINVAAFR